jgi:predicted O-methyltransferase YrrM
MEHFYKNTEGENWFTYPGLYSEIVNKFPSGSHFIEVGVWKGRSACYMAVEIINSEKQIKFDCVDTFEWIEQKDISKEKFSNLYETYLKNIEPVSHIINTVKKLSLEAVHDYADNSIDFIFIDAAHDYKSVKADIDAWLPKIKPGGIIAGHDLHAEGVKQAVIESFNNNYVIKDGCWVYLK